MGKYYDGTKLLSMKDIDGKRPEIYLCTTNRTGGKTTYFNRLMVNKFIKEGSKFMLVYRFKYQLADLAETFFKDIEHLFFQGMKMECKNKNKGTYQELFLDGRSCGYATALSAADAVKVISHLFVDVDRMLMDEFQSETNHYSSNEVQNLISLHTSVARGNNKMVRYVPLYMCSNTVTLLNPYYAALGISTRLRPETRFLRGNGYVLEQGFVEGASKAQLGSAFNQAFAATQNYVAYSAQNLYLQDNAAFIDKPKGRSRYVCTLRHNDQHYALREFPDYGILYCDRRPDMSYPDRLAVTTSDHNINYLMLKNNDFMIGTWRYAFEHGCFRFQDLTCKQVIFDMLSYY